MSTFSTLCIFTTEGHTFTFRNVDVLVNNETVIMFEYKAMSDGLIKTATFFKQHGVVGVSMTREAK